MAEPNANYIDHCHCLFAFPLSITSVYRIGHGVAVNVSIFSALKDTSGTSHL